MQLTKSRAKKHEGVQGQAGHSITLLQGAVELFPALIETVDQAQSDIRLETYTFDFTDTGADIGQALIRAAKRGVKVFVVVDGVGTGPLASDWAHAFQEAGVLYMVYSPLDYLGLLLPKRWRRLHRKLCVVDGGVLFCGGVNILDDLHDPNHGTLDAPRFDFSVRVTGHLVDLAHQAMEQLWWRMKVVRDARQRQLPDAMKALRAASQLRGLVQSKHHISSNRASLVLRDNVRHRSQIEKAYLRAIGAAREEIVIANAYFLPGGKLRRALILAARRGVCVRLLLQGRYEYFMQYHACRSVYQKLLKAGIEVYEYEPSFLHAKVAVIDASTPHAWATVGSSNLEPLSLLLAREANVVVQDEAFASDLRLRLLHAMKHEGRRVPADCYAHLSLYQIFLDRIAYGLMRLALWISGKKY
jgi:cardiolipin synthase